MSIYKIFPGKDATIYSSRPTVNAGRDEILEISSINSNQILSVIEGSDDIRRTLMYFTDSDLNLLQNLTTGSFNARLKLYLAYASALPIDYTIECYPVSQSWIMGTGKLADSPNPTNGVCWLDTGAAGASAAWNLLNGDSSYLYTTGGGTWNGAYASSQSFDYKSDKDLNIDVTNIVNAWFTGDVPNYGFLLKQTSSLELYTTSSIETKFFSVDTHTIYPPCLEFRWDDSVYNTGSTTNGIIATDDFILLADNNLGTFKEDSVYRMKFKARDRYPARNFTTSSEYLDWRFLPQQTYWALQDYKTREMIVDFDTQYTKLSADGTGNYFKLYTNGLQPERSYKVLIKAVLESTGEEVVVDNDIILKIER